MHYPSKSGISAMLAILLMWNDIDAGEAELPDGFRDSRWCSSPTSGMIEEKSDFGPGFALYRARVSKFAFLGLKVKSVHYDFADRFLFRAFVELESGEPAERERIKSTLVKSWGLPVEKGTEITGWKTLVGDTWRSNSGNTSAWFVDQPHYGMNRLEPDFVLYRIIFTGMPYLKERSAVIRELLQGASPEDPKDHDKLERLDLRPFTARQLSRWCRRG
jgi:hypothetical protein